MYLGNTVSQIALPAEGILCLQREFLTLNWLENLIDFSTRLDLWVALNNSFFAGVVSVTIEAGLSLAAVFGSGSTVQMLVSTRTYRALSIGR